MREIEREREREGIPPARPLTHSISALTTSQTRPPPFIAHTLTHTLSLTFFLSPSWRPYKWTVGFHNAVWSCLGDYWKGEGGDTTVELDYTMARGGASGVAGQRFKKGSIAPGGYIASRIAKAGKVSKEEMQACCYPAVESERDCAAVMKVVADYKGSE